VPCMHGTRIPVGQVLRQLRHALQGSHDPHSAGAGAGMGREVLKVAVDGYPTLSHAMVLAALSWSAQVVDEVADDEHQRHGHPVPRLVKAIKAFDPTIRADVDAPAGQPPEPGKRWFVDFTSSALTASREAVQAALAAGAPGARVVVEWWEGVRFGVSDVSGQSSMDGYGEKPDQVVDSVEEATALVLRLLTRREPT